MTHTTRKPSPRFPRAAALTASLGLIGCALEPADEATDDLAAEAEAELDADAPALDPTLPGFVRAPAPQAGTHQPEAALPIASTCPEGQVCDLAAPAARSFTIDRDVAPRRAAREDHAARKRPVVAADLADSYKNCIDIKFVEGSGLRARAGAPVIDRAAVVGATRRTGLAELERTLAGRGRVAVVPMHGVGEATLAAWKRSGEQATGETLPDLNLWQQIFVEVDDAGDLADLINDLNALEIVELARATPLPAPPTGADHDEAAAFVAAAREHDHLPWPDADRLAPHRTSTTAAAPPPVEPAPPAAWMTDDDDVHTAHHAGAPDDLAHALPDASAVVGDYTSQQSTYRGAAPVGMDIDYLRGNYWNAWGDGWGWTDVEYNWNRNHADLGAIAGAVLANGTPDLTIVNFTEGTMDVRHHGTAVVGILGSTNDGVGTTGLVPNAAIRLSTEHTAGGTTRAAAVTSAAAQFWKGAVILLEMQTAAGFDCNGDNKNDNGDYVPAEWDASVKDAVKTAVANGRIVVAAAGNGNCNLDHASFNNAFSVADASKDSGAIIVGAGERDTRNKEWFSTYGARVDVQGQGGSITTTGYGDLHSSDGYDRLYTAGFNGTSGASPMITAVAVALSGILFEYHGSVYDPRELRDLLRRDGTAQGTGGHIGKRPDVKKQIVHMHNRHVQMNSSDFNGDGLHDYAVWRPTTGVWYILYSGSGATEAIQWGAQGDIPVPANMTGDARAELVVFRPSSATWHVRRWDGSSYAVQWGQNGDVPVPMDHDNDGYASPTVFRQANMGGTQWSRWYIRTSDSNYTWFDWGENGDVPLVGDFDLDGRDDFAVFRGTTGTWYVYQWSGQSFSKQWGTWGDIPLIHTNGGRESIAVWRPSNGTFYQMNHWNNYTFSAQWGAAGDVPRLADTDNDGWSERIYYDAAIGAWYNLDKWWGVYWGEPGDMAVMR